MVHLSSSPTVRSETHDTALTQNTYTGMPFTKESIELYPGSSQMMVDMYLQEYHNREGGS